VIVSTSIGKTGSTIYGNIAATVVLQVDTSIATGSGIHKQLAVVLLEERSKLPSDPTLMRARLVWIPFPGFKELVSLVPAPAHTDFVLVSGVVQPGGTPEWRRLAGLEV
jgi:hypothetical protein